MLRKSTERPSSGRNEPAKFQVSPPIYLHIPDDFSLNAFAVWPRNLIIINGGTVEFAESLPTTEGDDVLAGVLSHELAHIFYRHSLGDPTEQSAEAVAVGAAGWMMIHPLVGLLAGAFALDRHRAYDRQQEMEVDLLGVRLSCAAGFDPAGDLIFHAKIGEADPSEGSFLRTHPSPKERMKYIHEEILKSCLRPGQIRPRDWRRQPAPAD